MRYLGFAVVAVLLLSACGAGRPLLDGGAAAKPSSSVGTASPPVPGASVMSSASPATPASPPTTSTSAPRMSLDAAEGQFVSLVSKVNRARETFNTATDAGPIRTPEEFAHLKALAQAFADALGTFRIELQNSSWPSGTEPGVDAVIQRVTAQLAAAQHIADAKSPREMVAAVGDYGPVSSYNTELLDQELGR